VVVREILREGLLARGVIDGGFAGRAGGPKPEGFSVTAAARKAKRRPAKPGPESAIYAGSVMLGEV
jgi:hypothetical protein